MEHMEVPRLGVQSELQMPVYTTAHGNARSLTHWTKPGIKPETSWFLIRIISTAPRRELQLLLKPGVLNSWLPWGMQKFQDQGQTQAAVTMLDPLPTELPGNSSVSSFFFFFKLSHLLHVKIRRLGSNWNCGCRATPQQCGIRAASVTYTRACGNTISLTHWVGPGIELVSSWILVGFLTHWSTTRLPWSLKFLIFKGQRGNQQRFEIH